MQKVGVLLLEPKKLKEVVCMSIYLFIISKKGEEHPQEAEPHTK